MQIRRAAVADLPALNGLVQAAKAYEGRYRSILDGYAITAVQVARDLMFLAETPGGQLLGFYSLVTGPEPELDLLFVADAAQGTGLGRALFEHLKATAQAADITRVKIVSHPPSEGFYRKMGAMPVGIKAPTAKATWTRPILELPVPGKYSRA
ncbi:GNAT family N-acetyltransferase [Lacibacterium aquatile]|uniref:GNAT family N-acetyltransferase n=1 Tax=Lacibacterium aquatile TaxID=1168082 RepID=A0ABW5DQ87_9PROT